jgi:putative membrane protein
MKKSFKFYAIAAITMICFGCNNSSEPGSTEAAKDSNATKMDSSGQAGTATMSASVSKTDAQFAVDAADAGMTEVQLGQMAEQKGTSTEVKDYGRMMVKDHTAAADKLKTLAASKNITLPTTVSSDMQKNIDNLQGKSGKDFDKAYISMMVDDHKKVISKFEDESKNGQDADVRSFADSTLHTLHHHLDEAEKCSKMEKRM